MTCHHRNLLLILSILALIAGSIHTQTLQNVIDCLDVMIYFSPCIEFVNGHIPNANPAWNCCSGVQEMNRLARESSRQVERICNCIELVAAIANEPPFLPERIDDLPLKCRTHLSFPISVKKNCTMA